MRQARRSALLAALTALTATVVVLPATPAAAAGASTSPNEQAMAINIWNTSAGFADGHAVRWSPSGQITDLGTLPGGKSSYADGINDWGEVVGASDLQAVRWSPDGKITILPSLTPSYGPPHSMAQAVNDAGISAGYSYVDGFHEHAVRWSPSGTLTDLGGLPGFVYSQATAINTAGFVVGYSQDPKYVTNAVRWDPKGRITELASPAGYTATEAFGINNLGYTVGTAFNPSSDTDLALEWDPAGHVHVLPTTDLIPSAAAINDRGTVVGNVQPKLTFSVPVVWHPHGSSTMLPTPTPASFTYFPTAINDRGVIVGRGSEGDANLAVRWDPNGRITILSGLPGHASS